MSLEKTTGYDYWILRRETDRRARVIAYGLICRVRVLPQIFEIGLSKLDKAQVVRRDCKCQTFLGLLPQQQNNLATVRDNATPEHLFANPNLSQTGQFTQRPSASRRRDHHRNLDPPIPNHRQQGCSRRKDRVGNNRHGHAQLSSVPVKCLSNLVQNIVLSANNPNIRPLLHTLLLIQRLKLRQSLSLACPESILHPCSRQC